VGAAGMAFLLLAWGLDVAKEGSRVEELSAWDPKAPFGPIGGGGGVGLVGGLIDDEIDRELIFIFIFMSMSEEPLDSFIEEKISCVGDAVVSLDEVRGVWGDLCSAICVWVSRTMRTEYR